MPSTASALRSILRIALLNPTQSSLHLVAVLQSALGDAFLQAAQSIFHARRKPRPDGFFFLLPPGRTAQEVGLFSLRNRDLLNFHILPHLRPVLLHQLT